MFKKKAGVWGREVFWHHRTRRILDFEQEGSTVQTKHYQKKKKRKSNTFFWLLQTFAP